MKHIKTFFSFITILLFLNSCSSETKPEDYTKNFVTTELKVTSVGYEMVSFIEIQEVSDYLLFKSRSKVIAKTAAMVKASFDLTKIKPSFKEGAIIFSIPTPTVEQPSIENIKIMEVKTGLFSAPITNKKLNEEIYTQAVADYEQKANESNIKEVAINNLQNILRHNAMMATGVDSTNIKFEISKL